MLTYIDVDVQNNPYKCGIEIIANNATNTAGGISLIKISRKEKGKISWDYLYTVNVESIDDFNFSLLDITVLNNKKYSYSFDLYRSEADIVPTESGIIEDVECWFDGMFVGNFDKQFVAGSNFKCDTKRNTEVAYVTTLSGRTPYRVSNSETNYTTGTVSGLFLEITNDGKKFIPDNTHDYTDEVVNFLTDGEGKILKTPYGEIWYVSIDQTITLPSNGYYVGYNIVQFGFTEIGDVPPFGMVVE